MIGMQSDLLGAHAMGVRNLLIVTGDPPRVGDYPDATAVFEVDSIGLTNLAAQLNRGLDIGGQPIGQATGFHIGVAANPGAFDLDQEIRRFALQGRGGRRVRGDAAGVRRRGDADVSRAASSRVRDSGARRHHRRSRACATPSSWRTKCRASSVPEAMLERMRSAEEAGRAREEGLTIARELVGELAGRVQGLQITVASGAVDSALQVLEAIRCLIASWQVSVANCLPRLC